MQKILIKKIIYVNLSYVKNTFHEFQENKKISINTLYYVNNKLLFFLNILLLDFIYRNNYKIYYNWIVKSTTYFMWYKWCIIILFKYLINMF